jgi:hypothetical protein
MITYDCQFPPHHHVEIRISDENGSESTIRLFFDGKRVTGVQRQGSPSAPAWKGMIGDMPIMVYIGGDHPAMLLTGSDWRNQVDGDCVRK